MLFKKQHNQYDKKGAVNLIFLQRWGLKCSNLLVKGHKMPTINKLKDYSRLLHLLVIPSVFTPHALI
jgi:hypothetical protein